MTGTPNMPPPPPPPGGDGAIAPRGIGDLVTAAFELYKDNIAKLAPIVAAIVVPVSLLGAILTGVVFKPGDAVSYTTDPNTGMVTSASVNGGFLTAFLGSVVVGLAVGVIIAALLQAAIVRAAAEAAVGDPVDVAASYKWGFRRIGPVIWISILVGLIVAGGLLLFIVPGIIFGVFLSVSIPALIVENQRGTGALGRSWNLVKSNWWHALGLIALAWVITAVVGNIIGAFGGHNWFMIWLTSAVSQIITAPFSALISVLLYVDLRARSETLTVERLRSDIQAS